MAAPTGRIPEGIRAALRARLERHARTHWTERCQAVVVRFRGAFAYVDALAHDDLEPPWTTAREGARRKAIPTRLCRLGYLGSADRWAFAFYKYSDEVYQPSILPSGSFDGAPEDAFDCAAELYLR